MGLLRRRARTAVVAGTAAVVASRVARRHDSSAAPDEAEPDEQPESSGEPSEEDLTAQLDRLSALRERGQLTDVEYTAAKAKLLGL